MSDKVVSYKVGEKTKYALVNRALVFADVLNKVHPYKPEQLLTSGLASDCKLLLAEVVKVGITKNSRLFTIVLEGDDQAHAVSRKISPNGIVTTHATFTLKQLVEHAERILNLQAELEAFCLSISNTVQTSNKAEKPESVTIPAKTLEAEIFS